MLHYMIYWCAYLLYHVFDTYHAALLFIFLMICSLGYGLRFYSHSLKLSHMSCIAISNSYHDMLIFVYFYYISFVMWSNEHVFNSKPRSNSRASILYDFYVCLLHISCHEVHICSILIHDSFVWYMFYLLLDITMCAIKVQNIGYTPHLFSKTSACLYK